MDNVVSMIKLITGIATPAMYIIIAGIILYAIVVFVVKVFGRR